MMNSITLTHQADYSVLTINRPNALNALNSEVFAEINQVVSGPLPESSRILVITGSGDKAFAAGADITEFTDLDGPAAEKLSRKGQIIFDKLEAFSIPTIALIHGYALGGGLELALACQIRVVTKKAILGLPELNLALIPGYGGTQRLAKLIGRGKAIYHTLSSENMDGEAAYSSGLADFLVEDQEAGWAFVEKFAKKLSFKSRISIRLALEAILRSGSSEGFEFESANFRKAFETEDMKEGVGAFLEKRKPVFKHS
jgi:enoyl-CoA hydratase/carnithine racemase